MGRKSMLIETSFHLWLQYKWNAIHFIIKIFEIECRFLNKSKYAFPMPNGNERMNEHLIEMYKLKCVMSVRKCYTGAVLWDGYAFTMKLLTYCARSTSEYSIWHYDSFKFTYIHFISFHSIRLCSMLWILFVIRDRLFTICACRPLSLIHPFSWSGFLSFYILLFTCVYVCVCWLSFGLCVNILYNLTFKHTYVCVLCETISVC